MTTPQQQDAPPVPGVELLTEQVRRVRDLRKLLTMDREHLAEAQRQFDINHADAYLRIKEEIGTLNAAEEALRVLAVTHFNATGEAKPTAGVEVKQKNLYTLTDPVAALAWAKQSGIGLVPETINEKAILKVATVSELPFVAHTTTPVAQISTDLDKVLDGAA